MNFSNSKATRPPVSICVVNHKTALLTKLCLRSIRRFTPKHYEMIVVDNDSRDESLDYLRSLSWIKLIERTPEPGKSAAWTRANSLDAAMAVTRSQFFIPLRSDILIQREGWLDEMLKPTIGDPEMACIGAGDFSLKPCLFRHFDIKAWLRELRPSNLRNFPGGTSCALYRSSILRDEGLRFSKGVESGMACGQQLYLDLLDKGYNTYALSARMMSAYVNNLSCVEGKIQRVLDTSLAQSILADVSLDN